MGGFVQRALALALLVFLFVALVYHVVRNPEYNRASSGAVRKDSADCKGTGCAQKVPAKPKVSSTKTVVYYFHRTARCKTCKALESNAREAIEGAFADELGSGALSIKTLNVDVPANSRFIDEYQVLGPSVVFSKLDGDKELKWKNLPQIWVLIEKPDEYRDYIVSELNSFLKAPS